MSPAPIPAELDARALPPARRAGYDRGVEMKILGVVLVVVGMLALLYGGISWTRRDKVLDAGPIEITAEKKESVPISPIAGGLMLVGGIALLLKRSAA